MSASDVLERYGTWRLLAFVGALVLFLALHLLRQPFAAVAAVLAAAMARVDQAVTASVSVRPAGPSGGPWTARAPSTGSIAPVPGNTA